MNKHASECPKNALSYMWGGLPRYISILYSEITENEKINECTHVPVIYLHNHLCAASNSSLSISNLSKQDGLASLNVVHHRSDEPGGVVKGQSQPQLAEPLEQLTQLAQLEQIAQYLIAVATPLRVGALPVCYSSYCRLVTFFPTCITPVGFSQPAAELTRRDGFIVQVSPSRPMMAGGVSYV